MLLFLLLLIKYSFHVRNRNVSLITFKFLNLRNKYIEELNKNLNSKICYKKKYVFYLFDIIIRGMMRNCKLRKNKENHLKKIKFRRLCQEVHTTNKVCFVVLNQFKLEDNICQQIKLKDGDKIDD